MIDKEEEEKKKTTERSEKEKELPAYFLKPWRFNPFSASGSGMQQLLAFLTLAPNALSLSLNARNFLFFSEPIFLRYFAE